MAEFTCAKCGGTFQQGWSDEEAAAEAKELFGFDVPADVAGVLCDECYAEFKKWLETLPSHERQRLDREAREEAQRG